MTQKLPELEKVIQKTILDYLELTGVFHSRINAGGCIVQKGKYRGFIKGAIAGFPDILVLKDGRFIGLEVKTPETEQNENQILVEKRIKENGGEYYVVRSLDEVKAILKEKLN